MLRGRFGRVRAWGVVEANSADLETVSFGGDVAWPRWTCVLHCWRSGFWTGLRRILVAARQRSTAWSSTDETHTETTMNSGKMGTTIAAHTFLK